MHVNKFLTMMLSIVLFLGILIGRTPIPVGNTEESYGDAAEHGATPAVAPSTPTREESYAPSKEESYSAPPEKKVYHETEPEPEAAPKAEVKDERPALTTQVEQRNDFPDEPSAPVRPESHQRQHQFQGKVTPVTALPRELPKEKVLVAEKLAGTSSQETEKVVATPVATSKAKAPTRLASAPAAKQSTNKAFSGAKRPANRTRNSSMRTVRNTRNSVPVRLASRHSAPPRANSRQQVPAKAPVNATPAITSNVSWQQGIEKRLGDLQAGLNNLTGTVNTNAEGIKKNASAIKLQGEALKQYRQEAKDSAEAAAKTPTWVKVTALIGIAGFLLAVFALWGGNQNQVARPRGQRPAPRMRGARV